MYLITPKGSVTGRKFVALFERMDAALDFQKKLAKEIGFKRWRQGYWLLAGGFSSVEFEKQPDMAIWRKANDGYMPRLNTTAGKQMQKRLSECPKVQDNEANECVGFDGGIFRRIGFARSKTHFGIITRSHEEWDGYKQPKDCKEITETEYYKHFRSRHQAQGANREGK